MTRSELLALIENIGASMRGDLEGRVAEVLRDQFAAICTAEKVRESDAFDLLLGPWLNNALARQHFYRSSRELLQGFYNWLRNEENEGRLGPYRRSKY